MSNTTTSSSIKVTDESGFDIFTSYLLTGPAHWSGGEFVTDEDGDTLALTTDHQLVDVDSVDRIRVELDLASVLEAIVDSNRGQKAVDALLVAMANRA